MDLLSRHSGLVGQDIVGVELRYLVDPTKTSLKFVHDPTDRSRVMDLLIRTLVWSVV
jgi:hypothetical protein